MKMKIPVGISGRHAHLSQEHLEILYFKNYEFKKKNQYYAYTWAWMQ